MFLKTALCCCLIPAVFTEIHKTIMFTDGVIPQSLLTFITFLTFLTLVFYTFMDRFFMLLNIFLCCKVAITLITVVSYTFMDRFFMCLKIALLCCLIPALLTRIHNTFMSTPGAMRQSLLTFITCLTFLTLLL